MEEGYEVKFPTSKDLKLLHKINTEYCADSIEWCLQNPYKNYFVCANYELIKNAEEPNKRVGRILLLSLSTEHTLQLEQTIECSAILDQKWCPHKLNDEILLGVVNSINKIEIYKLTNAHLERVTFLELPSSDSGETLILSLDWSNAKYESTEPELICSDSRGNIHLLTFRNNQLILLQSFKGHEFEAWISCFYYWDKNIIFSGGDDSKLCKYDIRAGNEPILKNRSHEAGVTSLQTNIKHEYILASGSYDSFLRLWDIRNLKCPTSILQLPGTLWRLKWDPFEWNHLLAACMLGGVHIINAPNDKNNLTIVESFYEHKNVAYGCDWSFLNEMEVNLYCDNKNGRIIGSCSFYDKLLCICKVN